MACRTSVEEEAKIASDVLDLSMGMSHDFELAVSFFMMKPLFRADTCVRFRFRSVPTLFALEAQFSDLGKFPGVWYACFVSFRFFFFPFPGCFLVSFYFGISLAAGKGRGIGPMKNWDEIFQCRAIDAKLALPSEE